MCLAAVLAGAVPVTAQDWQSGINPAPVVKKESFWVASLTGLVVVMIVLAVWGMRRTVKDA
ncbi:hypothetical protein [Desulfotignum phosphitoxidans]|uniref:hypothetical protein n=1 Tax=Desulfotignum phosphitoxidans TaxID=190898 RepID=UPI0003467CAD|nr:hypothetical protein [Desulfotignum phosphitoxidans]